MYLLNGQTTFSFTLRRGIHATEIIVTGAGIHATGAGIIVVSSAKARKPSPGFEGMNGLIVVLPVNPRVATGESPAPWTWDKAYIVTVLPSPRVMGTGR